MHDYVFRLASAAARASLLLIALAHAGARELACQSPIELRVDPAQGSDKNKGDARHPMKSIAAAVALVPDPVTQPVTIVLAGGVYDTTGGCEMPERTLQLMRRTRPGVVVRFVAADAKTPVVLGWPGSEMVLVTEGSWAFEGLQIGAFTKDQRRGITVTGPARVELRSVTFRLRSNSDAAIWARNGGVAMLRGRIAINEHLHEKAEDETFSGVLATEHGIVEFASRDGSALDLGNGSLSVRTYGIIRLGCERARITCWTQSNNLGANSSGRIDLLGTPVTLCARQRNNTPIGLEHDGHVLAEDAKITIAGANDSAIALQKASTFTCNDILLDGDFEHAIWASSGSMFVGRFLCDIGKVESSTGAGIHIEKVTGKVIGPVTARSGGVVSLPDRVVRSD